MADANSTTGVDIVARRIPHDVSFPNHYFALALTPNPNPLIPNTHKPCLTLLTLTGVKGGVARNDPCSSCEGTWSPTDLLIRHMFHQCPTLSLFQNI